MTSIVDFLLLVIVGMGLGWVGLPLSWVAFLGGILSAGLHFHLFLLPSPAASGYASFLLSPLLGGLAWLASVLLTGALLAALGYLLAKSLMAAKK
ncbi:MAG: hypothetical protein JRM78_05365 [Nitrososphaerota archaeon]|nr:hypothetical protein [Nitrososphaerota archaeon]